MALVMNTLFGRLGRLFAHAAAVRTYQGNLDTEYASSVAEYSGGDMDQIGQLSRMLESRKREATSTSNDLLASATKTLIDLTDDNYFLREKTLQGAIAELIKQMIASSDDVDANTISVGSVTAGGSNVGNGTLLLSVVSPVLDRYGNRPGNIYLQNARSEEINATCLQDQTANQIDAGSERFEVYGQRAVDRFDQDWPTGSGARTTIHAVNPRTDGGRGATLNICTNSDFESFTSNAPDHWTIQTGSAGTHILAAGAGYTQSNALKFVGDGSTTPRIYQRLRVTSETLGQVNPDRAYSISFAAKYATLAPGVSIRVAIEDDSGTRLNNAIIGREMSKTVTSASLTTSYQLFTGVVWSPASVPKGSRIVIEFTGNIANTSEVFIDDLCIAEMRKLGPGQPSVQMVSGDTAFRFGDTFKLDVTNNYAGTVAKEMDRFFDMAGLDLQLPANTIGSETILDSVVA